MKDVLGILFMGGLLLAFVGVMFLGTQGEHKKRHESFVLERPGRPCRYTRTRQHVRKLENGLWEVACTCEDEPAPWDVEVSP